MDKSKKMFLGICVFLIISISLLTKCNNHKRGHVVPYRGIVVKKYFYNNKKDIVEPRITFFCDTLQTEIDVLMDNKVFNKISMSDTISVELNAKYINLDE